MSEPKFTPGPWSVGAGGFINSDEDAYPVARVERSREVAATANARLIAAAPDLYAALERCVALFAEIRGDWTDPRDECREGMAIARAALAKAVAP